MATTGSTMKRSLVTVMVIVSLSGCNGSTTSASVAAQPTTSTASPSPSRTVEPVTDLLMGEWYRFGPFEDLPSPLSVVAKGPNGWVGYPDWAMDGPEPVRADAPNGIGISFFSANGLYRDPCRWDTKGTGQADIGDVKVGPTVDDMVTALRANTYYTSTTPQPVTIDGYAGKELELQLPDDSFSTCDKDDPSDPGGHAFVFSGPGLYAQGPANRWHLYILDVDGSRLISVIVSYAKTPKADLDVAQNVIDTMDIQT